MLALIATRPTSSSKRNVLAGVYRRKGGGCEKLRQEIEALAEGLEVDLSEVVRPRTDDEAEAERARLAGHFPFVLSSPELRAEQGLHPYALDVFGDPFISMGAAVAGGEQRVFVNAAWAGSFFDEEAARQMLEGPEALRPVEMFGTLVHPDDRAFIVPLLDTCLFGCPDALAESTHIFRVRVWIDDEKTSIASIPFLTDLPIHFPQQPT